MTYFDLVGFHIVCGLVTNLLLIRRERKEGDLLEEECWKDAIFSIFMLTIMGVISPVLYFFFYNAEDVVKALFKERKLK